MADLRSDLFAHLQKMELAFFTATKTGAIQSRLANDVAGVRTVLTDTATFDPAEHRHGHRGVHLDGDPVVAADDPDARSLMPLFVCSSCRSASAASGSPDARRSRCRR